MTKNKNKTLSQKSEVGGHLFHSISKYNSLWTSRLEEYKVKKQSEEFLHLSTFSGRAN